jgi:hypothetical protein
MLEKMRDAPVIHCDLVRAGAVSWRDATEHAHPYMGIALSRARARLEQPGIADVQRLPSFSVRRGES